MFGTPLSRDIDPEPSALYAVHDDHVMPEIMPVPSADVEIVEGSTALSVVEIPLLVRTVGRAAAWVGAGAGAVTTGFGA
jgi:hypothetical protein